MIGLRVDPTNQNRCDVILWSPQSTLPQTANIAQTAPAATVLPSTNQLGGLAAVTVRLWDAEGNHATPFLQFRFSGETNWDDASLIGTASPVPASPGGVNHTLVWDVLTDIGANIVTNILLRARASDMSLLGDWSTGTPFTVQTTALPDTDFDGIPDAWEMQFFGKLSHNSLTDSDGDGFNDQAEYIADTNPTNNLSYLHLSGVIRLPNGVKIDWLGGIQATQNLQRLDNLGTNLWVNISTNLPPTPISGSYTDLFGTNGMQFYRVRVTR